MKSTILVAEDSKLSRKVLKTILSVDGYSVLEAEDGEQAYEMAIKKKPDLMLLDVNMPNKTGFEAAELIKSNAEITNIPILFISASNDKQSIIKGFECGGQDYVTKPFNEEELLARIRTHLTLRKLNNELKDKLKEIEIKNKELNETLNQLEKTQKNLILAEKKNTVLAMAVTANHEINQPLTIIKGNLDLLANKLKSDEYEHYFTRINSSLDRIINIIEKFQNLEEVNLTNYAKKTSMIDIS